VHNQIPAEKTAASAKTITVVLDRSGSMGGSKIAQAVKAVDEFLSLLQLQEDASTLVNIVSFGSHYSAMYSHPVPATAANIAQMRLQVRAFGADFGGTELFHCLSDVVRGQYSHYDIATRSVEVQGTREHVVVLLTDGQVFDHHEIQAMLERDASGVRIMTIGIGRDADCKLVQKVADTTFGISCVLVDERDLTAALRDVLGYIDKQYYTDVKLLGHEVSQVSRVLYPAHPVDMFVRLSDAQYAAVARDGLSVTATDPVRGGAKVWPIAVAACVAVGDLLEKLYANHVINELSKKIDASEGNRAEALSAIVKLSAAHGIMNKHTSFLVISDEQIAAETLSSVQEVEVPHFTGYSCVGIALGNNFATASHSSVVLTAGEGTSLSLGAGMISLATSVSHSGSQGAIYLARGVGWEDRSAHVHLASGMTTIGDAGQQDGGGVVSLSAGSSQADFTGSVFITGGSSAQSDDGSVIVMGGGAGGDSGSVIFHGGASGGDDGSITVCGGSSAQAGSVGDVTVSAGTAQAGSAPDVPGGFILTSTAGSAQGSGGRVSVGASGGSSGRISTGSVISGFVETVFGRTQPTEHLVSITPGSNNPDHTAREEVLIMGADTSQPTMSAEERIVQLAQHRPGALVYHTDAYQLLQYTSEAALLDDAARAGLTPAVFFNVVCLLRARKVAAAGVLDSLEAYVRSVVAELKVAEVAAMLNLM
jgi:uncharacterized protein YegL